MNVLPCFCFIIMSSTTRWRTSVSESVEATREEKEESGTSVDRGANIAEIRADARQSAVDIENTQQRVALREKQTFVLYERFELVEKRKLW